MNGGTNTRVVSNRNLTQHINNHYINKKSLQKTINEIHSKIEKILDKISNNKDNYKLMFFLNNIWIEDIYKKRPYNCYDCYMKIIRKLLLLDKDDQTEYFNLINELIYTKKIYNNIN